MQYGIPTLIEIPMLEECAALCRDLGLSFIELNMNLPECQIDQLNVKRLKSIAEKYGIYYTIHLDENLSPCDFNALVASAYTETVLQTIELAKELSVPIINMHLNNGVYFTLPGKKVFLFEQYEAEFLRALTAFRDRCTAAIGDADIKICIENTSGYGRAPFIEKAITILLDSSKFALTFDTGHNATSGFTDEAFILARKNRLAHIHLHDAKDKDNHLPLGAGSLDIARYIDLARQCGCRIVLEVKTIEGLKQSLKFIEK